MTSIVLFMSLLWGTVFQVLWPPVVVLGLVKPPFLLAVVLYYTLNRGPALMLCAAVCAGFLQDATSLVPLGYSSAVFVAAGWLSGRYRRLVVAESWMTPLVFGGVTGAVVVLALSLLLTATGEVSMLPRRLALKMVGSAGLGAVTTWAVFALLSRVERMVGNVRTVDEII